MTTRIATATASAMADAAVGLIDAGAGPGAINVYSGAQPATANTAPTGTLLLTFTLNDPAFAAAAAGVATLDIAPALVATGLADAAAGWFRVFDSDGNGVFDGACATAGAQLNLSTTDITTGLEVTIESGSFTQPLA